MATKVILTESERNICQSWVQHFASKQGYRDTVRNADLVHSWIELNGGVYSYANLDAALEANKNNLDGIGVTESAAEKAAREKTEADRKKAEEARIEADRQTQVVQTWLTRHCPEGLKGPNGEPFPGDQDRLIAFVLKNYGGKFSIEALNHAVEVLTPVLTWFSDDREIRNRPAPPPRKMSDKALIDAGLKVDSDPRNHANDGKLVNPNERLRKIIKKMTGAAESPDQIAAEQISVTNRYGRVDHAFTAHLREIVAHNRADGSINWKETRRLRTEAADQYEKRRNRNGGQRG